MKRSTWVDVETGGRLGCNGEIFWSECAECDCAYCNPNYVCVCSEKVLLLTMDKTQQLCFCWPNQKYATCGSKQCIINVLST